MSVTERCVGHKISASGGSHVLNHKTPLMPSWQQTNKEIVFLLPLPGDVRGKEVNWKLTSQRISVYARGAEVLSGDFFYLVKPDDSTWELEDSCDIGRQLRLSLAKAR